VVPAGNGAILSGFTGNVRAVVGVDVGSLRIGNSSTYDGSAFTLTVGSATVDVPFGYRSSAIASAGAGPLILLSREPSRMSTLFSQSFNSLERREARHSASPL